MNSYILGILHAIYMSITPHYYFNTLEQKMDDPRIKIAVIDTGIDKTPNIEPYLCSVSVDLTETGLDDTNGHGTNVAGLIMKHVNPKRECLLIIKYYLANLTANGVRLVKAIDIASKYQARFINISSGGETPSFMEQATLQAALDRGAYISVAAGNDHRDLNEDCNYFPACYKFRHASRYFIVTNVDSQNNVKGNYGGSVNVYEHGMNQCALGICLSGTSQATANWTGHLVESERR